MSEPDGKPHWIYVSDTNQILDEWTEDVIAENYGDEAQGWLLAAAPALLAACRLALKVADEAYEATGFIRVAKTSRERLAIEAAIAAALPPVEPCQGPDMSYLDAPCDSDAEKP